MIEVRDLSVRFNGVEAVRVASLDITAGERVGVCGANGSGKTTLLRVLAGLLAPTAGTVTGAPPPGGTVLVHQRPYFFRGTARDNVVFALRLRRRPAVEAASWLEKLGASHLADRPASVLSGGERRRVALARALAAHPDVLLLDEPFAALDEPGAVAVKKALKAYDGTLVIAAPEIPEGQVERVFELS